MGTGTGTGMGMGMKRKNRSKKKGRLIQWMESLLPLLHKAVSIDLMEMAS